MQIADAAQKSLQPAGDQSVGNRLSRLLSEGGDVSVTLT
jgi:hypothetical protein